jgi:transposase
VIVFEDESGCSLLPSVRATWAPKGKTPVLRHRFNCKRLSMAAALVYEPDKSDADFVFGLRPDAYHDSSLIEFVTELHHLLGGPKVTLIWDGLPSHRSKVMTTWIAEQRSWLRVERLPGYAPELNPVEGVWSNVKAKELANLCPDTVEEMEQAADDGLCRIGANRELCFAFLRQTPLCL